MAIEAYDEARKIVEAHLQNLTDFTSLTQETKDFILTQVFFASDEIVCAYLDKLEEKDKEIERLRKEK